MHAYNLNTSNNTTMRIAMFVLAQTGTYQTQKVRPIDAKITKNAIETLQQATHGGVNLGVGAMQQVASDIICPRAQVEGDVNIQNSWRERRFRGFMKVLEQHPFQATTTQRIFTIYTDHSDASVNYLDPQMRIYFNNETIITERIEQSVNGPVKYAMISGSNQIIMPIDPSPQPNNLYSPSVPVHLLRPEDVFHFGQTKMAIENLQRAGQIAGVNRQYNFNSLSGHGGSFKYSRRDDTAPTRYLHHQLKAYQEAVVEANNDDGGYCDGDWSTFGMGEVPQHNTHMLFGNAATHASNQMIEQNGFLNRLREHAGLTQRGYVTYGDLCKLFPEAAAGIHSVTKYSLDNGQSIRKVNMAEHSNHWNGADPVSVAAAMVAQVVPALLMDNFWRSFSFAVTNGRGFSEYTVDFHEEHCRSIIDGISMIPYFREVERRLKLDLLNSITRCNQIMFTLSVNCDIVGDTIIDISLHGEPPTRFIAPTFADSLYSPLITRDIQNQTNICNSMLYLVDQVIDTSHLANNVAVANPGTISAPQSQIQNGANIHANHFGAL